MNNNQIRTFIDIIKITEGEITITPKPPPADLLEEEEQQWYKDIEAALLSPETAEEIWNHLSSQNRHLTSR